MIFADFGEGRSAPGVAPANNMTRRQANGLPSYGQGAGFLPMLPPNFAAVNFGELGDDVGPVQPQPTAVLMPNRSTTIPQSMTSFTALSTTRSAPLLSTSKGPSYQTAPGPQPISPMTFPVSPSPYSGGMATVGTAAAGAAASVGALVTAQPQSKGLSRNMWIGIGLLAAAATATGVAIVWKRR